MSEQKYYQILSGVNDIKKTMSEKIGQIQICFSLSRSPHLK